VTILVAAASRHGATHEIADVIGATLEGLQLPVEVARLENVATAYPYDAFILGSAVYRGSWLRPARQFLDEHAVVLSRRPTWLFSSGPIGLPPHAAAIESFDAGDLVHLVAAREHRLFAGKLLDPHELGRVERVLVGALHVPSGDFRVWDDVAEWATAIGRTLQSPVLGVG
jgi:menaquinone-dependent protoporphyrinogen oxidase